MTTSAVSERLGYPSTLLDQDRLGSLTVESQAAASSDELHSAQADS